MVTNSIQNNIDTKKDLFVSWEMYNKTSIQLATQIHKSGWEFDQIVAIARGGMFIGDTLSRIFKKPIALVITSSYGGKDGKEQKTLTISKEIAMTTNTLGKRILLVDDLVDSGGTIDDVKKFILQKYSTAQEIQTAVLWQKTGSSFKPDYSAESVDKSTWIHQPFEIFDDISAQDLEKI